MDIQGRTVEVESWPRVDAHVPRDASPPPRPRRAVILLLPAIVIFLVTTIVIAPTVRPRPRSQHGKYSKISITSYAVLKKPFSLPKDTPCSSGRTTKSSRIMHPIRHHQITAPPKMSKLHSQGLTYCRSYRHRTTTSRSGSYRSRVVDKNIHSRST